MHGSLCPDEQPRRSTSNSQWRSQGRAWPGTCPANRRYFRRGDIRVLRLLIWERDYKDQHLYVADERDETFFIRLLCSAGPYQRGQSRRLSQWVI